MTDPWALSKVFSDHCLVASEQDSKSQAEDADVAKEKEKTRIDKLIQVFQVYVCVYVCMYVCICKQPFFTLIINAMYFLALSVMTV